VTEAPLARDALVSAGIRRLAESGVESPAREAWWIWEKVSDEPAVRRLDGDVPISEPVSERFAAAVARRSIGEPLAYVLGEAAFRHLLVRSDGRALIPRPETEGLVDLVLRRQPAGRVLDVGTGSGCIALSLASEGQYELVVGVDASADAIGLARTNVAAAGLPVHLVRGDLSLFAASASFNVLVSNPPYLSDDEYAALGPSVKDWEPTKALVSGWDGMDATRRLLEDALRVVRPGGLIALEIASARAELASRLAWQAGWIEVSVLDDLFGRARYLVARRSE
jgi:release factor glutamine methyltransferase